MKHIQLCKTVLNAWQQDYQTLHDILNSEQRALEKRNFDLLSQVLKEKDEAVSHINTQQIPPMIDNAGIQITSLAQLKKYCTENTQLSENWSELMQLVEKCCLKNEVNARLIELLTQSSRRTFNLIKGFDPDNNIYNACGDRTAVRHYGDSISA